MKSTEQERALYECIACNHLYGVFPSACDCCENPKNGYREWVALPKEQAARRAQVVPDGWREALTELVAAMRKYEMDVDGIAPEQHRAMMLRAELLLSDAPQPPEATVKQQLTVEAAPVQLPELAGWIDDGGMVFWNDGRKPNDGEIIYTEQQVRELLAAHGIEVAQ